MIPVLNSPPCVGGYHRCMKGWERVMLLSPSRADWIIFQLEGVLVDVHNKTTPAAPESAAGSSPSVDEPPTTAPKALFNARWDKLPLPVGVVAADKNALAEGLAALGWQDLPRSRSAVVPADGSLEAFCRDMGCRLPLVIGSTPVMFDLFMRLDRGDFVAVGKGVTQCPIRFTTAADALRAIFGVV